jgi:hypothetical protein
VNSRIDSRISANGIYTAGSNESGKPAFDIIILNDTNNNVNTDVMVTVESKVEGEQTAEASSPEMQEKAPSEKGMNGIVVIIIIVIILVGIFLFLRKSK